MNLVDRVKGLILDPQKEWRVIDAEPHTVRDLYTGYAMLLAAIPAVAHFVGFSLMGLGGWLSQWRVPISSGVAMMVVIYLLSLGSVYVMALLIDGLAPTFGSEKNFVQALKLAVFSATPMWVAGVFAILPALGILQLLGLYGLYLLFIGMPIVIKTPEDKHVPYFVVLVIVAVVVYVAIGILVALTIPPQLRGF